MGNDYDSFGDFFDDVAEEYDKMDDSGFDSDESPSLGKFVSDLAEAASRASSEDTVEGSVERPGRGSGGGGRRSGGRELPDPPSLGDIDVGTSNGGGRGAGRDAVDVSSSSQGGRGSGSGSASVSLDELVADNHLTPVTADKIERELGKDSLTRGDVQALKDNRVINGDMQDRILEAFSEPSSVSSTGGGGSGLPFNIERVRRRGGPSEGNGIAWSDVAVLEKDGLVPSDVADRLLELFYSGQVEILQREEIEELYDRGVIGRDVQGVLLRNTGPRKISSHSEYYESLTENDLIPDTFQGSQQVQRSQTGQNQQGGGAVPEGIDVSEFGPEHIVELAEKGVLEEGEARTILDRMGVDVSGGQGRSRSRGSEREQGSVSVDEMVERFQRELEQNR